MSDLEPEIRPGTAGDGLDAGSPPASQQESAPPRDEHGRFAPKAEPSAAETQAWVDSITDPDLRAHIERQGFKSPEDLARSYREAERQFFERSQQVAALEQALQQQPQYQQEPADQGYQQVPDLEDIDQAYEAGEIDARQRAQLTKLYMEQFVGEALAARDQQYAPLLGELQNTVNVREIERARDEMVQTYGPDVQNLLPQAQSLMAQYPQRFPQTVDGLWSAMGLVQAQNQYAERQRVAAQSRTDTLNTGSRGMPVNAPQDIAAQVLAGIEGARRSPKDGL